MKTVLISQAEAEKIKKIGEAEAFSIEALGKAEAEKMRLKAEAYQEYGEAAKTALVLEALPKVNSWKSHGNLCAHQWLDRTFLNACQKEVLFNLTVCTGHGLALLLCWCEISVQSPEQVQQLLKKSF